MEERQYLQKQITDLAATLEAHKVLTQNALDSAGENKVTLKALHKRIDEHGLALAEIKDDQLTKDDITEILENSVNATIATGFKRVAVTIVAGIGAWIVSHFEAFWK